MRIADENVPEHTLPNLSRLPVCGAGPMGRCAWTARPLRVRLCHGHPEGHGL